MSNWQSLPDIDDIPELLPGEYWHIEFISGTYDRIDLENVELLCDAMKEGSKWVTINTIAGSIVHVQMSNVALIGLVNANVRKNDRHASRWLNLEAKQDPYLKAGDDD